MRCRPQMHFLRRNLRRERLMRRLSESDRIARESLRIEPLGRPRTPSQTLPLDHRVARDLLVVEVLDAFRLARRLERKTWTAPKQLASYGRSEIVGGLRAKPQVNSRVDQRRLLARTAISAPPRMYARRGARDVSWCAQAQRMHQRPTCALLSRSPCSMRMCDAST